LYYKYTNLNNICRSWRCNWRLWHLWICLYTWENGFNTGRK